MINTAARGDTTDSALAQLEPDVLSTDPRVVARLGRNEFLPAPHEKHERQRDKQQRR